MKHAREDYDRIQDPAGLIPEDEPVFLIRGQDKAGADTVRDWAQHNLDVGGDPRLSLLATQHADLMDAWPKKKLADVPEGTAIMTAEKVVLRPDADSVD